MPRLAFYPSQCAGIITALFCMVHQGSRVLMTEMSLTFKDFSLVAVQVVAFLEDRTVTSARIMTCVLKQFAEQFDGEPQAFPLPPDVPADIPRIILKSEQPGYVFQAGPARISCSWSAQPEKNLAISEAMAGCDSVIVHCLKELQPQINRLALVVNRAAEAEHPAQTLVERFCSKESQIEPFNRSSTFEIHNHKQFNATELELAVNSWVRCRTGILLGPDRPAVLVEQDLNTVLTPDSQPLFDFETAGRFYNSMAHEAEQILSKYFPNQNSPK